VNYLRNEAASPGESEPNSHKNSVHDGILLFDADETYLSWEREIPDTRERLYTPSISSLNTCSLHVRGQLDVLMQMEEAEGVHARCNGLDLCHLDP
jgi:hypothetical protein